MCFIAMTIAIMTSSITSTIMFYQSDARNPTSGASARLRSAYPEAMGSGVWNSDPSRGCGWLL